MFFSTHASPLIGFVAAHVSGEERLPEHSSCDTARLVVTLAAARSPVLPQCQASLLASRGAEWRGIIAEMFIKHGTPSSSGSLPSQHPSPASRTSILTLSHSNRFRDELLNFRFLTCTNHMYTFTNSTFSIPQLTYIATHPRQQARRASHAPL